MTTASCAIAPLREDMSLSTWMSSLKSCCTMSACAISSCHSSRHGISLRTRALLHLGALFWKTTWTISPQTAKTTTTTTTTTTSSTEASSSEVEGPRPLVNLDLLVVDAAKRGDLVAVAHLMLAGASGTMASVAARYAGHINLSRLAQGLSGEPPLVCEPGETPMVAAVKRGSLRHIQLLVLTGAPTQVAAQAALECGRMELVEPILELENDEECDNALTRAIRDDRPATVALLILMGLPVRTAFEAAFDGQNERIAGALSSIGTEDDIDPLEIPPTVCPSPVIAAVRSGSFRLVRILCLANMSIEGAMRAAREWHQDEIAGYLSIFEEHPCPPPIAETQQAPTEPEATSTETTTTVTPTTTTTTTTTDPPPPLSEAPDQDDTETSHPHPHPSMPEEVEELGMVDALSAELQWRQLELLRLEKELAERRMEHLQMQMQNVELEIALSARQAMQEEQEDPPPADLPVKEEKRKPEEE
eukprot:gnl/Trimastix_PCT/1813.p1 GENE.gnl/Trimastix_PCT/1813~~gnl/Trimastix_PCT/1813.p1  ORF type:complete len:476 (-),score=113.79 gnl/Trimastix_PCT/1813:115-1542(-)